MLYWEWFSCSVLISPSSDFISCTENARFPGKSSTIPLREFSLIDNSGGVWDHTALSNSGSGAFLTVVREKGECCVAQSAVTGSGGDPGGDGEI